MWVITGYFKKRDDRPNTEIIFLDDNYEECKKVYEEINKEKPDLQGLGMLGVNTEFFDELRVIGMFEMVEVQR